MKLIFSNILGLFVFDEQLKLIDKILFKNIEDYKNREKLKEILMQKHKDLSYPSMQDIKKIIMFFEDNKYFKDFYERNLILTRQDIKDSVNNDLLIIQSVSSIGEIDKAINILVKRLREWYSLYYPEFSEKITDNEKFSQLIKLQKKDKNSMGAELKKEDLDSIFNLSDGVNNLFNLRKKEEDYLESLMNKNCPNIARLVGITLGAKLIEKSGSLKKLAMFPASTIQLLGAEKALFRHLKNKKNLSPKYGILHEHPIIAKAKEKGKAARILADKISITAKVDYFKGRFIADKLLKEIEEAL